MFSMTTIASSTTKPVEIDSASSDKLSRLYPSRYITPNVPIRERGTAILGIIVAQTFRKNRNITNTTSATVRTNVNSMSSIEARMVTALSATISSEIDGGID